jgi:hypothetical protein
LHGEALTEHVELTANLIGHPQRYGYVSFLEQSSASCQHQERLCLSQRAAGYADVLRAYSLRLLRARPSAMLAGTDAAALRIWLVMRNSSTRGINFASR